MAPERFRIGVTRDTLRADGTSIFDTCALLDMVHIAFDRTSRRKTPRDFASD